MEEVKRTNTVIVNLNQWAVFVPLYNLYIIDINHGRNYYSCREFVRNYKNQKFVEYERRIIL